MTTTVSLFWIFVFVFIMHTALTYMFSAMMHSSDNDKNIGGFSLAVIEFVVLLIAIGGLTI